MSLPGKILFVLGIIYTIVGIFAKIFSVNVIDGASLILVGLFTVLAGIGGGFSTNDSRQSIKRKIFDWICFFLFFFGGILSYLREW